VKRGVATLTLEPYAKVPQRARQELAAEVRRLPALIEPAAQHHDVVIAGG
jgi:hypothetical protein